MSSPDPIGPEDEQQPTLPPPRPAQAYVRPPKSPGLALLLSLILPGIGQVYNGQPAKALVFFFGFVGSFYAAIAIHPLPFVLFIAFVLFFNLVDAYRSAALINARFAGKGTELEEDTAESPAWGITLILIGALMLMNNLGWLDLVSLQRYWPALLIVAGGYLLRSSIQKRKGAGDGGRL